MACTRERLVGLLQEREALLFGEFTLSSGRTSSYYIDLRRGQSFPDIAASFADLGAGLIQDAGLRFDAVVGVPLGGVPPAVLLSQRLDVPFGYLRKEAKKHGTRKRVEGVVGERVLVVDDVLTTGGSLREAVDTLVEEGLEIAGVLVLVDRKEGGLENLGDMGAPVLSVLTREDLLPSEK